MNFNNVRSFLSQSMKDFFSIRNWPNSQTIMTIISSAETFSCERFSRSRVFTQLSNLPIRLASIPIAVCHRDFLKVMCDVASFTALFFTHGRVFSIGIDLGFEVINFFRRHSISLCRLRGICLGSISGSSRISTSRADPKDFEGACKILNLQGEAVHDLKEIENHYQLAIGLLEKRKATLSPLLALEMQRMIEDVKTADKTLKTQA